jgi:DNA-binding LacI/PurR family transcriptional regulator
MTVHLKDLSQDLGLSAVTVSKALRNHPYISKESNIRGPEVSTAQDRLEGYRQALYEADMQSLPGHVLSLGNSGDHRGKIGGCPAVRAGMILSPNTDSEAQTAGECRVSLT